MGAARAARSTFLEHYIGSVIRLKPNGEGCSNSSNLVAECSGRISSTSLERRCDKQIKPQNKHHGEGETAMCSK